MKESKAIVKKEIAAMKKGGASKALIKHEIREHKDMRMKNGGKVKKKC